VAILTAKTPRQTNVAVTGEIWVAWLPRSCSVDLLLWRKKQRLIHETLSSEACAEICVILTVIWAEGEPDESAH